MQLLSIIDPRDSLDKATRWELIDYAKANGLQVDDDCPAIVTRQLLRAKGLTNIKIPDRPLGLYGSKAEAQIAAENKPADANAMNADELMAAQYQAEKTDFSKSPMNALRAECKKRGIKMSRRDNLQSLREKLSGQNAA